MTAAYFAPEAYYSENVRNIEWNKWSGKEAKAVNDFKDMVRGWFVGDFEPSAFKTQNCEVSYRTYKEGDYEKKHFHKVATEITVITKGIVEMNGTQYKEGDIIVMEPNDATDFKAITDAENVVVKVPGAKDNKYLVSDTEEKESE